MVEFSPKGEYQKTLEIAERNMAAVQKRVSKGIVQGGRSVTAPSQGHERRGSSTQKAEGLKRSNHRLGAALDPSLS